MQVPKRKPGKYTFVKTDLHITPAKFLELQEKLNHLKEVKPAAAAELRRTQEMGDLSENAAYSIAKGRLRSINDRIDKLKDQLNQAVIIKSKFGGEIIELGSTVELESQGQKFIFQILGSEEADPQKGIISQHSPIGLALMGKRKGDLVKIKIKNNEVEYKILALK